MYCPLTTLGLLAFGAVRSLATPASASQRYYSANEAPAVASDHSHAGHDHSDPDHMYKVHGIYRAPAEDGYIPMPLAAPGLLQDDLEIAEGGDGQPTADSIYSGLNTFSHLPFAACFSPGTASIPNLKEVTSGDSFDIAIVGFGFDTGTSYRPGARFGPNGIRQGSRRLNLYGSYNVPLDVDPFNSWARILDCGDASYDSHLAIKQMTKAHTELMHRPAFTKEVKVQTGKNGAVKTHNKGLFTKNGKVPPRLVTLGGDHTIVLPILRSINSVYGPVSVIHLDSHLDTWKPTVFGAGKSKTAAQNHGTYFWHAANEGLIRNGSSIHAGIRTTLSGLSDYANDDRVGFVRREAREIDDIGVQGIIDSIRKTVGDNPVYLSIDIDVLDPAYAPATGTPEAGGWSSRELRAIIRGLEGLNIVGADCVEVSPPFDTAAEITQIAAADVLFDVISLMVKKGPLVAIE